MDRRTERITESVRAIPISRGAGPLLTVGDLKLMTPMLGEDTIYALFRSGAIAARKVAGRWFTTPDAVQNWIDSITNGTHRGDLSRVDGRG